MSLTTEQNALLAKSAYDNIDKARDNAKTIHPDFDVDTEFSNNHTKVFHNPTLKQTVISHRGTNLKDGGDLIADTLTFFNLGKHSNRFKNAKSTTRKVIEKYSKDGLSTVGASLGGNIASASSKEFDIPAETYSKGKTLLPKTNAKKEKSKRVIGDPFSSGGRKTLPRKLNFHSIDNYT